MRKSSTAGLQKLQKTVPERKTQRKSCPEGAQKRASAEHGRARLREATKTQQNVITERRAHRKHEKGVKQKHERKPLTTPNADVPLVILPTRVRSKFAKQKKQDLLMETLTLVQINEDWGQSHKNMRTILPSKWGGIRLSYILRDPGHS